MTYSLKATRFTARSCAKVNLALEVIRRRRDGYHEIETILQSVGLYDELEIEFDRLGEVSVTCTNPEIAAGQENICHQAIQVLRPLIGETLGARIHIIKRIPHSAGLGGGSGNAAAVLLAAAEATAEATGGALPIKALERVAAQVGSDVPFMLHGGTMLGRGRGDILTRLVPIRKGFFLIVKPSVDIPTGSVYRRVNLALTKHRYRINLSAVNTLLSRFPNVSFSFRNALEDVVCPSYPLVAEVLEELTASKPRFASMSGSGSALFAIYESEARATRLAEGFSVRGFFTAVVEPSLRAVDVFPAGSR